MESYRVHLLSMSVIVLKKPLTSDIPDFNGSIRASTGYACTIWMELHSVDWSLMVLIAIDKRFLSHVPQLHCFVVTSWADQSRVWRKLSRSDPVSMSLNWELEFPVRDLEHFKSLIIRPREYQGTVCWKGDTLHRSRMTLNDLWMSFDRVIPNTNCFIVRSRRNDLTIGTHTNIINRSFVSYKPVGSKSGLEIPDHNSPIQRTRDALLQVRVKCDSGNGIFMTFEGSLQCWVSNTGKELWSLGSCDQLRLSRTSSHVVWSHTVMW